MCKHFFETLFGSLSSALGSVRWHHRQQSGRRDGIPDLVVAAVAIVANGDPAPHPAIWLDA
jgi:hypothetical protein